MLIVVTDLIISVTLFTAALVAANSFHKIMLNSILHAPMSFFDTTPVGRILNRFSSDIDTVDNNIPDERRMFLRPITSLLMAFIVICYSLPLFLVVLLPLVALFVTIRVSIITDDI